MAALVQQSQGEKHEKPSSEEDDQKARSNKKVKTGDDHEQEHERMETSDQPETSVPNEKLSFRDIVMAMEGYQPTPQEIIQMVREDEYHAKSTHDLNKFQVLSTEINVESDHVNRTCVENVSTGGKVVRRSHKPNAQKNSKFGPPKPKTNAAMQHASRVSHNKPQTKVPSNSSVQNVSSHADVVPDRPGKDVKEQEREILRIISQKQNKEWQDYKAKKSAFEDVLNQHVCHASEEELAHINALLKLGNRVASNSGKPPDIILQPAGGDTVMQEQQCSAQDSDAASHGAAN
ncbi:hypothetical protein RIF29_09326 [Crotalaria pallida]|uniref:Uncharacterized protein n=1 Tax=Crotalaria pallida TaxID=3830 RepID=A0AAN9IKJ2_CROPI